VSPQKQKRQRAAGRQVVDKRLSVALVDRGIPPAHLAPPLESWAAERGSHPHRDLSKGLVHIHDREGVLFSDTPEARNSLLNELAAELYIPFGISVEVRDGS